MNDRKPNFFLRRALFFGVMIAIGIGWWIGAERAFSPPVRGINGLRDFSMDIDNACVERTLKHEFGEGIMSDYATSIGAGNFPDGTVEFNVSYYNTPDGRGWASLDIGHLNSGTRVLTSFEGQGSKLPQDDFRLALRAMHQAHVALHSACGFDLSDVKMREVGQHVDVLH